MWSPVPDQCFAKSSRLRGNKRDEAWTMVDRDWPAEPMDSRVSFVTMNPMVAHTSRAGRADLGASSNSLSNSSNPPTSQNSMEGFDGHGLRSTDQVGEHHSLIYDAVSVNFSWRIFFAQIIIQVVPLVVVVVCLGQQQAS